MPKLKLGHYQVGTPRKKGDGLRIGTIREWPRGLEKRHQEKEHFDVWFPMLAPTRKLRQWLKKSPDERWEEFVYRYQRQIISETDSRQALILIAKTAEKMRVSLGCTCSDPRRCHRSVLLRLVRRAGTKVFQQSKASEIGI